MKAIGYILRVTKDRPASQWRDVKFLDFCRRKGEAVDEPLPWSLCARTREACRVNLLRYDRPPDTLDAGTKKLYWEALRWADAEFGPYTRGSCTSSYTRVLEALDAGKSPGLPFSVKYPSKDAYWLSSDAKAFDAYWEGLLTGTNCDTLCSVIGKEQLTSLEDLRSGKMRTVCSMDVNHVVAQGIFCLDQNERFKSAHSKTASAYGMTLFHGGAHDLCTRMKADVPSTIELDGKRFDARFQRFHFELIRDLRWSWFRPEFRTEDNYTRFCRIYAQLIDSPMVAMDGTIYERGCGNPSGQFCTTVDNTIKNFLDMAVLYMKAAPIEYRKYLTFKKFVRLVLYGDDVNITVDHRIQSWFNPGVIRGLMSSIDMEYTFASEVFRFFHECKFLGHGYALTRIPGRDASMFLPRIDCCKMLCSFACWGRDDDLLASRLQSLAGIRNETFACPHCRNLYGQYIQLLFNEGVIRPGSTLANDFIPDVALWTLYTGLYGLVVDDGYRREASQLKKEIYFRVQMSKQNRKKKTVVTYVNGKKKKSKYAFGHARLVKAPKDYVAPAVIYKKPKTFGQKWGGRAGKWLGGKAQQWFGSIIGSGAYRVNSNSLMGQNGPPLFGNRGGGVRVRHREFLTDISGSTAFAIANYYLNPGLAQTFPWLSNIAYNYEQYRFHGLAFEFKTTSATAVSSTNTALGTIIMATDYDDLDAGFTTKQQMEAYEFAVSTVPCSSVLHPIECSPRETPLPKLWVRTGAYSSYTTVDPRLYDLGNFQIASVGMQAAAVVGELWVTYDVEFFKPKLLTPFNGEVLSWSANGQALTGNPLMYQPTVSPLSTLPVVLSGYLVGSSYTQLTFPNPGQYLVLATCGATTSVSNVGFWTAISGCTVLQNWSSGTGVNTNNTFTAGSGTGNVANLVFVNVTSSNGIIALTSSLTIVGTCYYNIYVTTVASGFKDRAALEGVASRKLRELERKLEALEFHDSSHDSKDEPRSGYTIPLAEEDGLNIEADVQRGYTNVKAPAMWQEVGPTGKILLVGSANGR